MERLLLAKMTPWKRENSQDYSDPMAYSIFTRTWTSIPRIAERT
jgi:hypothetical protein